MDVAREVASTLGPSEQFDIGMAPEESDPAEPGAARSGEPGRLIKIDPLSPTVVLRLDGSAWSAAYPRLEFQPIGHEEWRAHVDRGIAANPVEEPS